jgi:hypothetical protein
MLSKRSLPPISSSEDSDGLSSLLVPAHALPPPHSGAALASWLAPSSAFPLSSCIQTQPSPPSAQAPLPPRLPRLSTRLPCLVRCGASVCACAALARGQKPPRRPQTGEHRRLRLSQPHVPVFWNHSCRHSCVFSGMASMARPSASKRFAALPATPRSVPGATRPCIV